MIWYQDQKCQNDTSTSCNHSEISRYLPETSSSPFLVKDFWVQVNTICKIHQDLQYNVNYTGSNIDQPQFISVSSSTTGITSLKLSSSIAVLLASFAHWWVYSHSPSHPLPPSTGLVDPRRLCGQDFSDEVWVVQRQEIDDGVFIIAMFHDPDDSLNLLPLSVASHWTYW